MPVLGAPDLMAQLLDKHLGLGLYIVRLIAGFHGSTARARNRDDGDGVVVGVSLPLHVGGVTANPAARAAAV